MLAATVLVVAGAGFLLDMRSGQSPQPAVSPQADTATVVITDSAPRQSERKHKRRQRKSDRRKAAKSLPAAPPRDFLADTIPTHSGGT